MQLYNTLSRKLEKFRPLNPRKVKIYTCGPTVYSYAHIGNMTSYIYWDLLIRTLKVHQYTPYRVLNLTDVGHLSSDADDGEDKIEKTAKKEQKTVWEIADYYTERFLEDFEALSLTPPEKICKATDYIQQDIDMVKELLQKGYAYQTSDGIYFDTAKFSDYAKLARLNLEELKAGARVEFNAEKRNFSDFALWKFIKPDENHVMRWDFLDRPGYPGWHIECSAIIHAELGETIDIHTGGIDHIPIHHTNEIAQSESAYGKKCANFWIHCNFINIDNQKISKSLGNTITISDLVTQGFSPLDFKMWVYQGHYQSERNFSINDLRAAKTRRLNWKNRFAESLQLSSHSEYINTLENIIDKIKTTISDNLNSAATFSLIDSTYPDIETWRFIDQLFGLGLTTETLELTNTQKSLIEKREIARKNKDFKEADNIRNLLAAENLTIKDTKYGPIWQYLA